MVSTTDQLWRKVWQMENQAIDLYLESRYQECILLCQEILSTGIEEFAFDAHRRIGLCYYYLHRWDESLTALRQALRRRPTDVRIRTIVKRVQDILMPPPTPRVDWSSGLRQRLETARVR